jgi:hypothetical protein
VSRDTQGTRRSSQHVVYRAVTVYGRSFQIVRLRCKFVTPYDGPYNPTVQARWFGLFRVRSPLLAESLLFSIPAGTEMVHFPALPSTGLCIQPGIPQHDSRWVAPFGNPRVEAYLQLTGAYRSLSRPSSTLGAKAFTVHP